VVKASIGDHAQVANEVVVRGAHAEAADDLDSGIENRFDTLRRETPELSDYDLDLRVANGVATLSGEVATEAERVKSAGLVRSIPGVREIVNSVKVNPDLRRPAR
jgi:osmotically-inducible protein OsmY